MTLTNQDLLDAAIAKLKINVPIYRYEIKGKTVTLWLYGASQPVKYTHRQSRSKKK